MRMQTIWRNLCANGLRAVLLCCIHFHLFYYVHFYHTNLYKYEKFHSLQFCLIATYTHNEFLQFSGRGFSIFAFLCSSHNLDERFFSQSPLVNISQVRWHPASSKDNTLMVLLSDNTIRWVLQILFNGKSFYRWFFSFTFFQCLRQFCAASCVACRCNTKRPSSYRHQLAIPEWFGWHGGRFWCWTTANGSHSEWKWGVQRRWEYIFQCEYHFHIETISNQI